MEDANSYTKPLPPPASEWVKTGVLADEPKYIAKKTEYHTLFRLIKRHKLAVSNGRGYNISAIVNALSIDPKTARRWLETPKIQQAIQDEVEYYISKMQETGADDWRQWAKQIEFANSIRENGKVRMESELKIMIVNTPGCFKVMDSDENE